MFAVAGIAKPQTFFTELRAAGIEIAATRAFRDHHPYTPRDVARLFDEAVATGAGSIITTEKDYVRLLPFRPFRLPVGWVPLTMDPEPADAFRAWLRSSMASARDIVLG
jgi:tetraacyldisaccharide 4'-kinase